MRRRTTSVYVYFNCEHCNHPVGMMYSAINVDDYFTDHETFELTCTSCRHNTPLTPNDLYEKIGAKTPREVRAKKTKW